MTKEDFVILAGGIENANDGQLDSTEILKNGNWDEGTYTGNTNRNVLTRAF